jgi:WD40 repeat protein
MDPGYCAVFDDFLSREECQELIALAEARGFNSAAANYPPTYRNNDRLVLDDPALAGRFHGRLQKLAPPEIAGWRLDSVNERLRFCRYSANQQFSIHQDGVHHRGPDCRSMLTFMIYLTDGSEFTGGDTEFFAAGPRAARAEVLSRVRPKAGRLILFDHALWHAGAVVTSGTKYIVRSDVLYRRKAPGSSDTTGHQGYVWTLARLGVDRFASGGRDCRIRISDGRVLSGHTQSVLGLALLDERHLASVSRDRTLRIWNLVTARCEHHAVAHDAAVLTVVHLGQGRLATGGADCAIKIWNQEARQIAGIQAHSSWVWKLARLSDNVFASASEDGSVKLWHSRTGEQLGCFPGGTALRTLAVSPDAKRLVTGDVAGRVRIWNRERIEAEFLAHDAAIRCLTFLDSNTLASGGEDFRLRIWTLEPPRTVYEAEHQNFVTDIISMGNGRCASCAYDGEILLHR